MKGGETIDGPRVIFLEEDDSVSPEVQIITSLRILERPPYKMGDTITEEFSIRNTGNTRIAFDV